MQQPDQDRLQIVRAKAEQWADELIDLGPRNTLLYYKDTKSVTLDLTGAPDAARDGLLGGRKTRLSALVSPDGLQSACTTARGLRRRMIQLDEEQGITAGRLAVGLLRVDKPQVRGTAPVVPLRAPLLLQTVDIEGRTASETDYTIEASGAPEINPVLLYALARQYGVDLDPEALQEKLDSALAEQVESADRLGAVYGALRDHLAAAHLTFSLEERTLIGLFSFEKLPMVADLRGSAELLASHDVVAAIAGYQPAAIALDQQSRGYRLADTDRIAPDDEFLVQPADSSQQQAMQTALDGRHVVIQGPPGTGKSQTIANIIAGAIATGKRVLFVAEKRAAIEAVTERLAEVKLDHLVFDLHHNKLSRREVAQQIADSLSRATQELAPSVDGVHRALDERRRQAVLHVRTHHDTWPTWNVSLYQVYCALLALPPSSRARLTPLRGEPLRNLSGDTVDQVKKDLERFVNMGGLAIHGGRSPWSQAKVRAREDVQQVVATLDALTADTWQRTRDDLAKLVAQVGLPRPSTVAGWQRTLQLLSAVEETIGTYSEEIFLAPLADWCYATGNREYRSAHPRPLGWWQRRKLRKQALGLRRAGTCETAVLHGELCAAAEQLAQWQTEAANDDGPVLAPGLDVLLNQFRQGCDHLSAIALWAGLPSPEAWSDDTISTTVDTLNADTATLHKLPELTAITDRLTNMGLARLLDELVRRNSDAAEALEVFDHLWYSSLLEEFRMASPYLAQFAGRQHDRDVTQFQQADRRHIELNAQRVRRRVAERLAQAQNAHPDQRSIVKGEANKKSRHMSVRRLVEKAPDVLLAARPCWAMSPIVVSRLLPAQRLFDLVVFDEASQVEPVDAMASIMRGKQLVVAGDEHQLPPNRMFQRSMTDGSAEPDEDALPEAADFESILTRASALIGNQVMLRWHYRSEDERLIAFSNHEFYGDELITLPSPVRASPLRLHRVDGVSGPGSHGMCRDEVDKVVELVLDHVRSDPTATLGVITLNEKQAAVLELALRHAAAEHPELADFQARMQGPKMRLFIKGIEQVQGDERDVIIFSLGRTKSADGKLSMYFGHLNHEGGERRLNVAVSRARRSLHVVAAFDHHDMVTDYPKRGPELLRRFLEMAATGAAAKDVGQAREVELNGFERSIADALTAAEVPFTAQWGVSDYRIDFALHHPARPGEMVLAIEADGDSYHRSASARDRDRLRQEHLERLGWSFHRVWASEWFLHPAEQLDLIVAAWRAAVAASDQPRTVKPTPKQTAPASAAPTPSRGPRPGVPYLAKIDDYRPDQLDLVCRWVLSDQLAVDRETRVGQVIEALGFRRRGRRIVEQINAALARVEAEAKGGR
jgi:very-short-patch-repair endonuclease